ncbi:MAG: recombinase family protein [Evtepia sp.]|uniref:recombinase family protein n=1 Tax=Evtepia sp. TaxID=2773933 RepID=UPI002A757565|nr:recombinase family protein [Evtepia sp.]MDY3015358.1 recombinase family protein [Evtepia sp.]
MEAAQYLRKSRMEEGMDTREVLAKHQKALADYARENNIRIVETYREVVSGESLYARPEMLRLLRDVEEGTYDAVLCMDLDRLSRGRMRDQRAILDAFKDSGTLIITPEKTYDLTDELDDELAEFKTFLSRREYKIINKRLRRGIEQSVREGCYLANAPYGYQKTTLDKRPTLAIQEEEARFVRMMYELYAQGYGCVAIARQVTLLGARPRRSSAFSRNAVAAILRNPTYTGKVVWNQRRRLKTGPRDQPRTVTATNPREDWTITQGLHPPIIPQDLYDQVQQRLDGKLRPVRRDGRVKAPLAGLVRCGNCGSLLQKIAMAGGDYLVCPTKGCCAAAQYPLVEARLLDHLEDLFRSITWAPEEVPAPSGKGEATRLLAALRRETTTAEHQKLRLYELLEQGIYDPPTFQARMAALEETLARLEATRQNLLCPPDQGSPAPEWTPTNLWDAYQAASPPQRNALLHTVLQQVIYRKEKKSRPGAFSLQVFLKPC